MWNPFTGYMEQYYPASEGSRALMYNDQDGAVCIQVEVFFTPGCVVDGVTYQTVADTPLKGWAELLDWADSLGVPRVWPMGAPQWAGNSRDVATWNGNAGHYGHCNSPGDTHTDPGPMPSLGAISVQSADIPTAVQEDEMLIIGQATGAVDIWIGNGLTRRKIGSPQELKDIQYLGGKGFYNLAAGGAVQTIDDIDALGADR
jgi:hypothetical protein